MEFDGFQSETSVFKFLWRIVKELRWFRPSSHNVNSYKIDTVENLFTLQIKAEEGLSGFTNAIGHRSINRLLTLLLCECNNTTRDLPS